MRWGLFQKNSSTTCSKKNLIGGHDLVVRGGGGVSKIKVDLIFIFFREFNMMLEIVH